MISADQFERLCAGQFVRLTLIGGPNIEGYATRDPESPGQLRIDTLALEDDGTVGEFSLRIESAHIDSAEVLQNPPTVTDRDGIIHRVQRIYGHQMSPDPLSISKLPDASESQFGDLLPCDRIVDEMNSLRVLATSENFTIGHDYENAYLSSPRLPRGSVYLGDFYGDPYVALIDKDEKWCAVGGCGLIVYRIEKPFPDVDKLQPSTQYTFIEYRPPDGKSWNAYLWIDSLAQVGPSDLEIITQEDETYHFSLPKRGKIMPSLLQERDPSVHTGVELSREAFESFFRAIQPFCWRVQRKGGVILTEMEKHEADEIQVFYVEKLLSYQHADGFIWVTGAVGKELREKLIGAASVEDSSDRRLTIELLRDVENNGLDSIISFELQSDSL